MNSLDVDKCLTKAQKTAFQRDLKEYVLMELNDQGRDIAERYVKQYLKEHPEYVTQIVEEAMEAEKAKLAKSIRQNLRNAFDYY